MKNTLRPFKSEAYKLKCNKVEHEQNRFMNLRTLNITYWDFNSGDHIIQRSNLESIKKLIRFV